MSIVRSIMPRHSALMLRSPLYYRLQKFQSGRPSIKTCLRHISRTSVVRASVETRYFPQQKSLPRRVLSFVAIALTFTIAGFTMAVMPAFQVANGLLHPPTDAETLTMFTPQDEISRRVEDFINNHPLTREMRSKPEYSESRPHLKIPESQRSHNLTGGTLLGPDRVVVPPFTWTEKGGKSLVQIQYLGSDLCGYPGIIHGGFLATICDEGLARCCFEALPNKIGMTATLSITYRIPVMAESFVVLRAETTKVEGRKAWAEGRLETLVGEGETPDVLAETGALFIEPKQAAVMSRLSPV